MTIDSALIEQYHAGFDTFFEDIQKTHADDAELVADVQEVDAALTEAESAAEAGSKAKLKVAGAGGYIGWSLPGAKGSGTCNKKGAGGFSGNKPEIAPSAVPGTYNLTLTRTSATLELRDDKGGLAGTYNGIGLQKGLSGTWTGKWSRSK